MLDFLLILLPYDKKNVFYLMTSKKKGGKGLPLLLTYQCTSHSNKWFQRDLKILHFHILYVDLDASNRNVLKNSLYNREFQYLIH